MKAISSEHVRATELFYKFSEQAARAVALRTAGLASDPAVRAHFLMANNFSPV